MPSIEHIAMWVNNLEEVKQFYIKYFNMVANQKYVNPVKQFQSYFLSFGNSGARIELMQKPNILPNNGQNNKAFGLAHIAINIGDAAAVNTLTEQLRGDGYTIAGEPRVTGDGYYESVVLDPEGNYIEITAG
jgi:lactoylglutathione lyase